MNANPIQMLQDLREIERLVGNLETLEPENFEVAHETDDQSITLTQTIKAVEQIKLLVAKHLV